MTPSTITKPPRPILGVESFGDDFPLLASAVDTLHYLDNAATTQKPEMVIDSISNCYRLFNAPIHRGLYPLAESASSMYEQSRAAVAGFIGAADPRQLIFTRSATESINLVARGWVQPRLQAGDEVWISRLEHHANLLPWQAICRERGARLRYIELTADGGLDVEGADTLFGPRTRLIAISYVSNVLGTINPVGSIIEEAARQGIPVLLDAAQAVGHIPVNVMQLDCDFLAFSAHKMYGPNGIGALYAQAERLEEMEPLLLGGGMVDWVGETESQWSPFPAKFEAGSPNLAGAVGFSAAVEYLQQYHMESLHGHVRQLVAAATERLQEIPGVTVYAAEQARLGSGIVSFNVDGVHPHDVGQVAGEQGVAIRAGHHCCQPLMQHLGVEASARASFAPYNRMVDVDALIEAVSLARDMFAL
jgi:cysteine desulfurase/selenocysteine lyase